MELIEEVEKTRRGLYGGVLGYLDFAGNADFAIAIRTALMRDGTAYVQAGGGVVADSNGPYEYTEAANKARAVLNAIAAAETLRPGPRAMRARGRGRRRSGAQVLLVLGRRRCGWPRGCLGRLTSFDGLGQPKVDHAVRGGVVDGADAAGAAAAGGRGGGAGGARLGAAVAGGAGGAGEPGDGLPGDQHAG